MTRKEARAAANRIAYRFVQQALDTGAQRHEDGGNDVDAKKIRRELDAIAQRLFQKGEAA